MPRPQRIEFPGAWYLVENTAANDVTLFQDDDDYQGFLDLLEEMSRIFSVEVHGYCLLDDQIYLLLHTPQGELSRAMRHLNGVYTQRYNQAWGKQGAVFRGRYKSLVIDPEKHLMDVLVYIHSRAVDAGFTAKASDYRWSSHRGYVKEKHKPGWLTVETLLKPLGFIRAFAVSKLNKLVAYGISEDLQQSLKRERTILGSLGFKEQVKALNTHENKRKTTKIDESKNTVTANEILDFVSFAYKVPVEDIRQSQSGVQNEARSMAVYQLRTVAGMPQKEIARVLNSSSGYTVAKTLQRFNDRLVEDSELAKMAANLTETIQEQVKI